LKYSANAEHALFYNFRRKTNKASVKGLSVFKSPIQIGVDGVLR
jgi:hypothetical protein